MVQKRTNVDSRDRDVGDLHALVGSSVRISSLNTEGCWGKSQIFYDRHSKAEHVCCPRSQEAKTFREAWATGLQKTLSHRNAIRSVEMS